MYRRTYLGGSCIVLTALAGCTADDGGDNDADGTDSGSNSSSGDNNPQSTIENESPSQEDEITITEVELLTETVTTGDEVELQVSIQSEANDIVEYPFDIEADGETVSEESFGVNPNARTSVVFRWVPDEAGEYDLSVNGVNGGTVSVQ